MRAHVSQCAIACSSSRLDPSGGALLAQIGRAVADVDGDPIVTLLGESTNEADVAGTAAAVASISARKLGAL